MLKESVAVSRQLVGIDYNRIDAMLGAVVRLPHARVRQHARNKSRQDVTSAGETPICRHPVRMPGWLHTVVDSDIVLGLTTPSLGSASTQQM